MNVVSFRTGRDLRQSKEYGRFMEKIGWKIVNIHNSKSNIQLVWKKTGFLTVAKIRRPRKIDNWTEIKNSLNKHRVNICRIDPETASPDEYKKVGFRLSQDQMVATKTLVMDISQSEEKILLEFKTETRRKLRQCSMFNIQCSINEFDKFYEILKNGYKEIDVWCPPKSEYDALLSSFGKKCFCVTIDNKAGCLVIIHKQVAEYYYASATGQGKTENLPYWVAWQGMLEAKRRGAKVWDWNGLYDERFPEKRYVGFSFFKKRFGGTEFNFAGGFLGWRLSGHW